MQQDDKNSILNELMAENDALRANISHMRDELENRAVLTADDVEAMKRLKSRTHLVRREALSYCEQCGAWQRGIPRPVFCYLCGRRFIYEKRN